MKREDTFFKPLETLTHPLVMGIINLTPDSFYTGSRAQNLDEILKLAENHIKAGANLLDLGAVSTRPGAEPVSEEEEKKRLLPCIEALVKKFPGIILSVDTFRAGLAAEAIACGASMINDITAGEGDIEMLNTVARLKVPYVMMHMRGNPQTMQGLTVYKNFPGDIVTYFSERIRLATDAGIKEIWIDPGIGFAKTAEQNFTLIRELKQFEALGKPILMGISRKSFIYKKLGLGPEDALNGSTALHMTCLMNGAKVLRVHDVKEAVQVRNLYLEMYK